jgi:similar to spore coat protein
MQQQTKGLATHETLELLEMLTIKNVCLTKSKTMQALVSDPELKTILQNDVQTGARQITELTNLVSKAQCH